MTSNINMALERYAQLCAKLAASPEHAIELLEQEGLDHDQWTAICTHWDSELSDASEDFGEQDGVPELLIRFNTAFEVAHAAECEHAEPVENLDIFLDVLRRLQHGEQLVDILKEKRWTTQHFVQTQRHWTLVMRRDPQLAQRFNAALLKV